MGTFKSKTTINPEKLRGNDFLALEDYTADELNYLLDLAKYVKQEQKAGNPYQPLKGRVLGMIFEKSSTRTRVSFETGIYQLGGQGIFLSTADIQLGRGETIADTARVLSGYLDGIMIRTFGHDRLEELAEYASIPVINGLTDLYHPCQVMADFQTIIEEKGQLAGQKLAYIGDSNNMTHTLMIGAAIMGMDMTVASPDGYLPDEAVMEKVKRLASESGATIKVFVDPNEAVQDADVIYSDVWASMGKEAEQEVRLKVFADYQVDDALLRQAKSDVTFLHCLPAHRGEEVTESVLEGKHSKVFQQAENRLHAQKAIMAALMQ